MTLQAGPLQLIFDNGILRSICIESVEIIRRIYFALRDQYWNTLPYTFELYEYNQTQHSFSLSFAAYHQTPKIQFTCNATIQGTQQGVITATFNGYAENTFMRNRIGWCVLHPLSLCKGATCILTLADDSIIHGIFPGKSIAPFQPFPPFKTLRYPISGKYDCICSFSGDLFELEDQRNWTDASFKTYSTPQSYPAPVQLKMGDSISQTVTITVTGSPPISSIGARPSPCLCITKPSLEKYFRNKRPQIGICTSPDELPLLETLPTTVFPRGINFLRFVIDTESSLIHSIVPQINKVCEHFSTSAEIAFYLPIPTDDHHLKKAAKIIADISSIKRILLLHKDGSITRDQLVAEALDLFSPLINRTCIFSGTDRYFVEYNRAKATTLFNDTGICFSATPQVHTFDNCAIMENLEGLEECITSAVTLSGNAPVALTPITLRPRKTPLKPQKSGGSDTRQSSLFAASWLVGVLSVIIRSNLYSCTLFSSLSGHGGYIDKTSLFFFPVYQILSSGILNGTRFSSALLGEHSPQLAVIVYQINTTENMMLFSNCTNETIQVSFPETIHYSGITILDESTLSYARGSSDFWDEQSTMISNNTSTIQLTAYGIARIIGVRF